MWETAWNIYIYDRIGTTLLYSDDTLYSNVSVNSILATLNNVSYVSNTIGWTAIDWTMSTIAANNAYWDGNDNLYLYDVTPPSYSVIWEQRQNWVVYKFKDYTVTQASSAPSNPIEWAIWYDTTNNVLKTFNGSTWDTTWWVSWISSWQTYDYSSSHPATITLNSSYYNHSITIDADWTTTTTVAYGSWYTPTPWAQYSFDIINPSTNDLIITILWTQLVVFGDDEGYVHNIFNFIYDDTAGMYRVIAWTENLLTQTQYDSLNAWARTDWVLRWIVEK